MNKNYDSISMIQNKPCLYDFSSSAEHKISHFKECFNCGIQTLSTYMMKEFKLMDELFETFRLYER